jgi:sugar lactone lactonase YvrE
VHVIAPDGKRIARFKCRKFVRICVLVAAKKTRLFMAAGQSLYSLNVNPEGAQTPEF